MNAHYRASPAGDTAGLVLELEAALGELGADAAHGLRAEQAAAPLDLDV